MLVAGGLVYSIRWLASTRRPLSRRGMSVSFRPRHSRIFPRGTSARNPMDARVLRVRKRCPRIGRHLVQMRIVEKKFTRPAGKLQRRLWGSMCKTIEHQFAVFHAELGDGIVAHLSVHPGQLCIASPDPSTTQVWDLARECLSVPTRRSPRPSWRRIGLRGIAHHGHGYALFWISTDPGPIATR